MSTVYFYIISEDSGKALDVQGDATSVVIHDLHGGANQQWIIHKNGNIESVAYRGKVLDINGAGKQNMAKLCLWSNNGNDNQRFTIDHKGHIYAKHSGKVLDVEGASHRNGTAVVQYDLHGRNNQKWRLVPVYDFSQKQPEQPQSGGSWNNNQQYQSGGSWNIHPLQPYAPPPQPNQLYPTQQPTAPQQPYVQPPYAQPLQPNAPMNDMAFQGLLRAIQQESFESGRKNVISTAASYNYFTCAQLARVFNVLSFSSEKIFAAQALCPKIVDKHNSHIALSALTFDSEKQQVAKFFRQ
jgi:hypothetical protein